MPTSAEKASARLRKPVTLSVDVGASHIKAHLLDRQGKDLVERLRVETPEDLTPTLLVRTIAGLAKRLPGFDRVSVGVPGIVHRGMVYSMPLAGDRRFRQYPLAKALTRVLASPVRLLNDAEMHGLGVIRRRGVELVLTLGSGLGMALYLGGDPLPGIGLVPPPRRKDPPGGPYGDGARKKLGNKRWSKRIERLLQSLRYQTNFDRCYLGGGNADRLTIELPEDVVIVETTAAGLGGVRLWEWNMER
jgi:polyphosphate glucokinase